MSAQIRVPESNLKVSWKQRLAWWAVGSLLAVAALWALPGNVIRINGAQLHGLVGGFSSGGHWKIQVHYFGSAQSTQTVTGDMYYGQHENYLSTNFPASYGFDNGGGAGLSGLDVPSISSSSGSMTAMLHLLSGADQLVFPGPMAGTVDNNIHLVDARIQFLLTWIPNDYVQPEPAPRCVTVCYKRTVTAEGDDQGALQIDTTADMMGLSTESHYSIPYTSPDSKYKMTTLQVTGGQAFAEFAISGSIHITASGNDNTRFKYGADFAEWKVDLALPGYDFARNAPPFSGDNSYDAEDPSYTRWLPLSFSPHVNSQQIRFQAGALPAPWGNLNSFYSIALRQEPNPPNYDLFGAISLYVPDGSGYKALPNGFEPAYSIMDANGDRLVFGSNLAGYDDVHSTLTYNPANATYTLANAGPPGALRQAGRYSYTFFNWNLTSITDDLGNQQTCTWDSGNDFLVVSDSSSGRSLIFHRASAMGYVTSVDALGPTGVNNTHTVIGMDGTGHMTGRSVYDATGTTLFSQDGLSYGGANGDAILSRSIGLAQSNYTYTTDSNLIDPFGLSTDRLNSVTNGASGDTSSSDDGGSVQGTIGFTWGPTQTGYNDWGSETRTNTVTNQRGVAMTTVYELADAVCGSGTLYISQITTYGPAYGSQPANSNVLRMIYTPSIVNPMSVTAQDPLFNAGVTQHPWETFLDSRGNVTRTIDPLLEQWQFGYDANGTELTSITDPTNLTWTFNCGENGQPASRLTSILDPGNATRGVWTYNIFGQVVTETVPAAVSASGADEQTLFNYFPLTGDLNTVTDPVGDIFQINSYDLLGDPLSFSAFPTTGNPQNEPLASWLTTTLTYNAAQNVTNIVGPNGVQAVPTFNNGVLTGLQILAPAAMGGATLAQESLSFDSRGRFYKVQDSFGTQAEYRFDKANNITKVMDGRGNTTLFTFGLNNEPTAMQWPDGHTRSISYDVGGRIASSSDERGISTIYTLDPANRLTQLATPNFTVLLSYDAASRLQNITDSTGQTQFNYDATRKRLQSVATTISALPAGNRTFTTAYSYYGDGKVATMTSVLGQTSYSYAKDGSLSSMADPFGGNTSWQYDHIGRMTRQTTTTGSGTTLVTNYLYGTSGLTGDPATAPNYLNQIVQTVNGQTVAVYTLQHSLLGQILSQTGSVGGESKAFTYDLRGRLRTEDLAGSNGSLSGSYAFDNSDNLQGGTGGWTYNTSNQVTSAPSLSGLAGGTGLAYDNAGNLTSFSGTTLTWDDLNWLSSAGATTFTTDAAGRRVSKTTGGVTTYFVYDGHTPIAELNSSGQVVKGYVWGPAGLVSDQVSGQTRFYLYDGIGNTRSLISATGTTLGQADYSAFGSVLSTSGQTTPFGWQGQSGAYTDSETGLVLLTFRYYAPALGRFISRDPSGFAGGMNLYGYCTGDPVNVCDAIGLDQPNLAQQAWEAYCQVQGLMSGQVSPQEVGEGVFRGIRTAGTAGMTWNPHARIGNPWSDGSCEAEYVNGRLRDHGRAMDSGINYMGGMMVVQVAFGALDAADVLEFQGRVGQASVPGLIEGDVRALTNPSTGRFDASFNSFDRAFTAAREATGELGEDTLRMIDPETGTLIGEQSRDGIRGWRIDDEHVNYWNWTNGKKGSGGQYGHCWYPEGIRVPHSRHIGYAPWE